MNLVILIIGIVPLIAFAILDTFASLKVALCGAVFFAVVEVVASLILFHDIDIITIFSFAFVLILAFLAYNKKASVWFKFQPVALSTFFGLFMIGSYLYGEPLFHQAAIKYATQFPAEQREQLLRPEMQRVEILGTLTIGIAMLFHAITNAIAAIYLSTLWWLLIRGIGFYIFMIIGLYAALFLA